MIERYTRKPMGQVWEPENKFAKMRDVEVAVAQVQASEGIIPKAAATAIKQKSKFNVKRIAEIEKTTKHDVIAFVSNLAENVGEHGRFIHYGLTSSDVLDTALSLQIREAGQVLLKSMAQLNKSLSAQVRRHEGTLCAGRTHGMHAEPTSFGLKLAGHLAEHERNTERLEMALEQLEICKLSGAVGTYSALSQELEAKVAEKLKLQTEVIATQVVPRDRHAEVLFALAMVGSELERLSVELRHLQRTEVAEVFEGFSRGQKGSSAMPHKKNPISAENITGAARLLRSYLQAAMEDISLWHERDISHSSVERVIFPDAFILCDYAVDRMARVIEGLQVDPKRMKANMNLSQGQIFSSHLLLALVKNGLSREEAYALVQKNSHALNGRDNLSKKVKQDKEIKKLLKASEIDKIFSGEIHKKSISKVVKRAFSRSLQ